MNSSRIVFCDFDGIITAKDTFVSMLEKFTPKATVRLLPAIFHREISLKEATDKTLGAIPVQNYPAMIDFIAQ